MKGDGQGKAPTGVKQGAFGQARPGFTQASLKELAKAACRCRVLHVPVCYIQYTFIHIQICHAHTHNPDSTNFNTGARVRDLRVHPLLGVFYSYSDYSANLNPLKFLDQP